MAWCTGQSGPEMIEATYGVLRTQHAMHMLACIRSPYSLQHQAVADVARVILPHLTFAQHLPSETLGEAAGLQWRVGKVVNGRRVVRHLALTDPDSCAPGV